MRSSQLFLAMVPVMVGAAADAWGFGFGELRTDSRLGERLRAEIDLVSPGGAGVEASCFRLAAPSSDELPALSRGRIELRREGGRQALVVHSAQPVTEPLLQVAVQSVCADRMTRTYMVLLSPPEIGVALPAAAGPAASLPPAGVSRWEADGRTTLAELALARYPGDPAAQRRFVAAIARANPDVFPDRRGAGSTVPPTGVLLDLPEPGPAPVASAAPRPPRTKRVGGLRLSAPRLVIGTGPAQVLGDGGDTDTLRLKLATETSMLSGRSISEEYRNTLRLEYRTLVALSERATAQVELAEKLRQADEALAAMQAQADRIAAAAIQAPAPTVPPSAPAQAGETATPWYEWAFYGGIGLAVLGLGGVLAYRGRRRGELSEPAGGFGEGVPVAAAAGAGPADVGVSPAEVVVAPSSAVVVPPLPAESGDGGYRALPGAMVAEMFEATPAMELADVMLSFGRVGGAAQTLREYIDNNPKEELKPWLKLLDVYRLANMREEFDLLAGRLNRHFNVEVLSWDDPYFREGAGGIGLVPVEGGQRAAAAKALTLEDIPHIADRLLKTWGSPVCLEYLNHLLHDNRDGERSGFTLPVVQEILLLIDILDARLAGVAKL